jgi:putative PEP-CTERM system histidine kinase
VPGVYAMPSVSELSFAVCALGAGLACFEAGRTRGHSLVPVAVGLAAIAGWVLISLLYLRMPFSPQRVHALLIALCLAPAPWLAAGLALCESDIRAAWQRWRGCLIAQGIGSAAAAVSLRVAGVDWITGIGPEPAVVLTRWGLAAIAIGALPSCTAVALIAGRLPDGVKTTPALLLGALGAASSPLWVTTAALWHGYLTPSPVAAGGALAAVAVLVAAVGAVREMPLGTPLVPSRRLVYGAAVAGLVAFYLVAAHVALRWATEFARQAGPEIAPAFGFVVVAALVGVVGSTRLRHRLWVTIGQQLFRSKHDYGDVWIRLTELVSAAHTVPDLVHGAATLCRNVLGGPEVSVWLADSSGGLRRATATAAPDDVEQAERLVLPETHSRNGAASSPNAVGAELTQLTGASLACALLLNGRVLGAFAIGSSASPVSLDDEDRRLVRYIVAQVASALGLFQLGEEVADAREVGSFHRLSAFVVHDLKNLVAQQSLVLENAAKFGSDPAFVQDALAAFEDSTGRMRSLIGRLRSRESTSAADPAPCDVLEVIQDLVARQRVALRHGTSLQLVAPAQVRRCPVSLDRPAAAQLFSNLLVNAIESLPIDGGEITISIHPTTGCWRVDVQDTGVGIPASFLRERVFRPFHTTKEQGLGIGLYQCKSIVDAAGGTINVSSTANAGTLVQVTLPALELTDKELTGNGTASRMEPVYGKTNASGG